MLQRSILLTSLSSLAVRPVPAAAGTGSDVFPSREQCAESFAAFRERTNGEAPAPIVLEIQ